MVGVEQEELTFVDNEAAAPLRERETAPVAGPRSCFAEDGSSSIGFDGDARVGR